MYFKMNQLIRKRQSSESHMTGNTKCIKTHQLAKENIPPELCETVNLDDNNIVIQNTTPKKIRESLKELPVTPSTNVKLLASLAADLDYLQYVTPKSMNQEMSENQMSCESDPSDLSTGKVNRKEKSLGIICSRFVAMFPLHPPVNKRIIVSLDDVCTKLGVGRRRLYDIVNVFESIDILAKNAKNQYLWFGKNNLLKSLFKLKEAAIKENILEKLQYVLKTDISGCKQSCILNDVKNFNKLFENPDSSIFPAQVASQEVRKEKSLGIMSQKFLMLFLVSPDKVISLGVAAKVLNGFFQKNENEKGAQIKTQIRRLYDIANVLSSIGLIQKETSFTQCIRKPSFRYIGPDLKDYKDDALNSSVSQSTAKNIKSRSLARHSSFQEICAVAEIEHQKLSLKESYNSAPPFESSLIHEKENAKISFENLQLKNDANNKITKNTNTAEGKPAANIPLLVKQNLKVINLKKPAANPTFPYFIINGLPVEKLDVKHTNSTYGNQTFLFINTIIPSKEVKTETSETQSSANKVSSPQTIILSPGQRDAILQSLNISLSSGQTAAIHLDGASESNSSDVPCNVLKIMNKNTPKLPENKNIAKISLQKDTDSNDLTSVNNTRSNTPSSIQTLDSPFSMPSGYVTPIPNVSSDISFASSAEVNDILKNIESQPNTSSLNSKTDTSIHENIHIETASDLAAVSRECNNRQDGGKLVSNNYPANSSMNQVNISVSNDSYSNDSVNSEVSNIFKGKCLSETLIKPKPFLIDEKTLLSPIKTSNGPVQISVPSNLNTPPCIVPKTMFVFSTPTTSYQTTKVNDISNLIKVVPNLLTENKKMILPANANVKFDKEFC